MFRIVTLAAAGMLGLATAAAHADPGPIQQRIDNQQQRINNGVDTGALTHHEATRDESADARLEADRNRDLADHGGHLTAAERANLNRRLNHSSQHIYGTKHNARVAPPGR
jgi:hypothetical protein